MPILCRIFAEHEEQAVIAFVNKFTTCTLNEAVIASKTDDETLKKRARDIVQIVEAVNKHRDTKSCRKYNTKCRFGFPRFPIWKTLISRPMETSGEEGDKLKQKYKKVLKDVKELLDEKGITESILEQTPKDLDTTLESYQKNRKKRVLKLLSIAGYKSEEEIQLYDDALKYSTAGYSVLLERDIDELFINSYNPEWALAWNGNTDLQVCLDYFAVITYITEYYTKDDTGMMTKIIEMLKNTECDTLRDKMKLVMNTFISARQMGECEAYFKILPDSNVATVFVPTGSKETRSKFMIKVEENDEYNGREKKKIDGRKGWFVEKYDLIDKYVRRDRTFKEVDDVSVSQFLKMYDPAHKQKKKNQKIVKMSHLTQKNQNLIML